MKKLSSWRNDYGVKGNCAYVWLWAVFLLTASLSPASADGQDDGDNRKDREDLTIENSPVEEFFSRLVDSAKDNWEGLWGKSNRDTGVLHPFSLQEEDEEDYDQDHDSDEEREDYDYDYDMEKEEKEYDGEIDLNQDDNEEVVENDKASNEDQIDLLSEFSSSHHDIFDIKRMKRKLQLKKYSNNQRRLSKQRKRKRRRQQQRRKLMKTLGWNTAFNQKKKMKKKAKEQKKKKEDIKKVEMDGIRRRTFGKEDTSLPPGEKRPNIVLIVADDLGFNDVPWHNPDVRAPHILKLARQGVILENHYVLPLCTPSRAALLTGVYPFRYGKQGGDTSPLSPTGLNTSVTLLPERLKTLGYSTHLVGKWHLGYCSWDYTPTRRGFDSFYGFYLGSQTYFTQYKKLGPKKGSPTWLGGNEVNFDYQSQSPDLPESLKDDQIQQIISKRRRSKFDHWHKSDLFDEAQDGGRDFRFNETPLSNVSGTYSNELYAQRAEEIIKAHATQGGVTDAPLFMMLSTQAVHGPVQVPLKYRRRHTATTKNLARRTFLGMVNALDDVVGRVVAQLKSSGLYQNTIIAFTTDNGGNIQAGGNNFPLRGNKGGVFEGGTRGVAFIHSPLLPKKGYKYDGMMHMIDLHETLLHVAQKGASVPKGRGWKKVLLQEEGGVGGEGRSSLKTDISLSEERDRDGINMWQAIITNSESPRKSFVYNVRKKPLRGAIRRKNWKLIVGDGGRFDGWVPPWDVYAGSNGLDEGICCTTWQSRMHNRQVTLYNLKDDPLETTDVSYLNPSVTATLKSLLKQYASQSRQPQTPRPDPRGHPNLHGGFFSPGWCQAVS